MELKDLNLFEAISKSLFDGAEGVYSKGINFIDALAPICSLAFGVYVVLQVFHYYNKGFDESLVDISKRLVGWIIVIALAFNAQNIKTIGKMGWELPDNMASVVMDKKFDGQAMDKQFKSVAEKIEIIEEKRDDLSMISPGNWGVYLAASMALYGILACAMLLCGVAFGFYVLAKMLLLLALTFAPIFLASLLFPATRQFGTNWINSILNYSLTITAYAIVGIMQIQFIDVLLKTYIAPSTGLELTVLLFLVFGLIVGTTIIFCIMIWNVPSLIGALVGSGANFSFQTQALGNLGKTAAPVGNAGKAVGGAVWKQTGGRAVSAASRLIKNRLAKG